MAFQTHIHLSLCIAPLYCSGILTRTHLLHDVQIIIFSTRSFKMVSVSPPIDLIVSKCRNPDFLTGLTAIPVLYHVRPSIYFQLRHQLCPCFHHLRNAVLLLSTFHSHECLSSCCHTFCLRPASLYLLPLPTRCPFCQSSHRYPPLYIHRRC